MTSSKKLEGFARRCAQALLSLAVVGVLAACGGGGSDAGTPIFQDSSNPVTPPSASTLVDLALVADKQTVPNTGAEVVTYTVTALGAGNAALIGVEVPVTVEVDAGAVVTPSAKVTDKTSAKMTAVVALIDKTSRTVNLTAKSGAISKKLSFNVVDSVTGSAVADMSVVVDKITIPNTGAEEASITVTTLDAARSAIGGVAVSMQVVDVGDAVVLDPGNTTTGDSTGQLTRRLKLQNNKTKRTIAVKATSGTVSRTITVDVVDPPAGTVLTASDLTLSISKNSINNSGSETVDVIARAVDANRNALAGIDVIFRVDSDAVLTPINTKTDAKGEAKATVGIGANRTVRTITVSAESSALKGVRLLSVTGAKLQATVNQPNRLVGEQGSVDYSLLDVNGSPIDGVEIVATGPGGASGRGFTNGQGKWTYSYKAEGNGKMSIKAVGGAGDTPVESFVNVAAKPAALDPAVKILSATMTMDALVVKVNEIGKDVNRAEIRILFRGEKNAPIENVRVHIGLGANNTSTDGRFSVSESDPPLLSDKNGLVTVSFIAGERPSPTDGVKIQGCYGRTDDLGTTANGCLNGLAINPVTLTVVETPVSISIGGDDVLAIGDTGLTYIAKFTVLVVDSAGNPKSDVQVTPMVDLLGYGKGQYVYDLANKKWVIPVDATPPPNGPLPIFLQCPNEDRLDPDGARNGTLEVGEDINGNLQLDPRKSDVSVALEGSTKTDKNGLATLRIEYPKSMASWVRYMIKVSAPGVLSPPAWYGRYEERWLPALTAAIKSDSSPAFQISPYGIDTTGYKNSSTDPLVPIGAGCFTKK
ncbi:Ig-like domain-containing protein [Paucibacter sp. B2R-40]|uniref:Ig-like domain-containing protein n=1 Tax=Paucibacter sp. B2R-40 TaxID=2893554 RepID=UPI0021E444A1|nr:Ig-like domain-containing protein [Paucibacter sp. B2R-40]MCV2356188.1 Ig-like domain-containing protein [Paucibacter sp. B2R-40]